MIDLFFFAGLGAAPIKSHEEALPARAKCLWRIDGASLRQNEK